MAFVSNRKDSRTANAKHALLLQQNSYLIEPDRMFGMFAGGPRGGTWERKYRAYPVSFIDKAHLENGDKVILPPSALEQLAQLHVEYPMLFQITNVRENKTSHCGVLEFSGTEGQVYLPYWMMQNLLLEEGDIVNFKNVTLRRATFVKLRPQSKDFLDISNHRAVLEKSLRSYTCLTVNDSILISYNDKRYFIDILETKPNDAVSIVETDCEVDFAAPLDWVEPVRVPPPAPAPALAKQEAAPPPPPEEPKFQPFVGGARRLDGKPSTSSLGSMASTSSVQSLAPSSSNASLAAAGGAAGGAAAGGDAAKKPVAGKIVFGGARPAGAAGAAAGAKPGAPAAAKPAAPAPAKEEPKFVAFQGKANRLA